MFGWTELKRCAPFVAAALLFGCSSPGAGTDLATDPADMTEVRGLADGSGQDTGTDGFSSPDTKDHRPEALADSPDTDTPDNILDPDLPDGLDLASDTPPGDLTPDTVSQLDLSLDTHQDTQTTPSDLSTDGIADLAQQDTPDVAPDQTQETDQTEVVQPPPCPLVEDLEGLSFAGTVFFDTDGNSDSFYQQSIGEADAPLEGVTVSLRLPGEQWQTRTTCPDGNFAFGGLAGGLAISTIEIPEAIYPSTANAPARFPEAIDEGAITILTFGDSVPAFGAQPFFPDRLADMLDPFAVVHSINVAVPGTATSDWLPSTNRFKQTLLPLLPEADVVVISLGGNDMNYWVGYDNVTLEEALQLASEFPVIMQQVRDNLDLIFDAVHQANPSADIVYLIYPNYAVSTFWKNLAPDYIGLIGNALKNELGKTRKYFSRPGMTLVDMLGATPLIDLDACLSDPLHLSETGTIVWARQIFLALGGLDFSPPELGTVRNTGLTTLP